MNSAYDCSHPVDIADEPHHHLVIANEYVRAFAVDIPPRTRTLCHRHPSEYLLYVAQGAEIVSAARDEEPKRLSYADGECELSKAGLVHVVDNLGESAFRNIVVEMSAASVGLKRGAKPVVTNGDARVEDVLGEVPGAVFTVEMVSGAEVEIAGPAVIAAPYEAVMVKEVEEFDVLLDGFKKLMWVCAQRRVGVRNTGSGAVRLVVLSVGTLLK